LSLGSKELQGSGFSAGWLDFVGVVGGWLDFQDLSEAALDATAFLTTQDSKALLSLPFLLVLYPPPPRNKNKR